MAKIDYVPYCGPIVTRDKARALGLTRYFSGKPCPHGHIDERSTANGTCLTCKRLKMRDINTPERLKAYYEANAEMLRQKRRDYTAQNRSAKGIERQRIEAIRRAAIEAGEARYYTGVPCKHGHICGRLINSKHCEICHSLKLKAVPPERMSRYKKKYIEKDPEAYRAYKCLATSRRRARKLAVGGKITIEEILTLKNKQKNRCANPACKRSIKKKFHRDHIIALVNGGPNTIENTQLLCPPCNLKKNRKDPLVWMREQGFLL